MSHKRQTVVGRQKGVMVPGVLSVDLAKTENESEQHNLQNAVFCKESFGKNN